ncbi:hypothetical protein JL722_8839 [Aureococcus anophagefferens]|nr:hypothetical protein JL722_8839 [Aureococcus anophagefferens]
MDLVNGEIPDAVAAFVEARGDGFAVPVRFVDARAAWLQATGCDASDVDGACEAYYDDDGMHTSDRGSDVLAAIVRDALEGQRRADLRADLRDRPRQRRGAAAPARARGRAAAPDARARARADARARARADGGTRARARGSGGGARRASAAPRRPPRRARAHRRARARARADGAPTPRRLVASAGAAPTAARPRPSRRRRGAVVATVRLDGVSAAGLLANGTAALEARRRPSSAAARPSPSSPRPTRAGGAAAAAVADLAVSGERVTAAAVDGALRGAAADGSWTRSSPRGAAFTVAAVLSATAATARRRRPRGGSSGGGPDAAGATALYVVAAFVALAGAGVAAVVRARRGQRRLYKNTELGEGLDDSLVGSPPPPPPATPASPFAGGAGAEPIRLRSGMVLTILDPREGFVETPARPRASGRVVASPKQAGFVVSEFADLCTDLESPRTRRVVTPPQDLHKVDLEVAVAKTPAPRARTATRRP